MNKKLRQITETAVMLALLVALQAWTKPMGQLVTGSFVNAVLAVTVLFAGCGSGLIVALISPVLAYLLGIAPQILTVPAIMVGNALFVTVLHFMAGKRPASVPVRLGAWLAAAAIKFAALYAIVVWLICGAFAPALLETGALKEPMLTALPATFSWMQLFTALIGGGAAMMIVPVLKKALKR